MNQSRGICTFRLHLATYNPIIQMYVVRQPKSVTTYLNIFYIQFTIYGLA